MPKRSALRKGSGFVVLLCCLSCAAVGGAQTLSPVLYDDAGTRGRQPHIVTTSTWTFSEADVAAPEEGRTVAHDPIAVRARYDGLSPAATYAVRVVYATEKRQARAQRLTADGVLIHDTLELPMGSAGSFDFPLPREVCADGVVELSFEKVTGPNAVVSELWLLSDTPYPALELAAYPDLSGSIRVAARDGLMRPVAGAEVCVTMPAADPIVMWTDAEGRVDVDVRQWVRDADPSASIAIEVHADGLTARQSLVAGAVFFHRPVLSPIPHRVAGVASASLRLDGTWRFAAEPQGDWTTAGYDDSAWSDIDVPGEWVMQGFTVSPGKAAGYRRTFHIPADWAERRVKIRFDGVYSIAEVYVNGHKVGGHEGGFTPFEVEITDAVSPGHGNTLALAVTSESMADTLASASSYARHPLGGIARGVTAFCVPRTHLTRFHAETQFDSAYGNATLRVFGELDGPVAGAQIRCELRDPEGQVVPLRRARVVVPDDGRYEIRVPVERPAKWDSEHPHLYTLACRLVVDGAIVEETQRRIGFRQVEVRGAQLLVNGTPVKLHGVCRHEQNRDRGRSTTPEIRRRDVELMEAANINYVRTSHYPPDEQFLDLCDEHGIFVQDEGPWCWVSAENAGSPDTLPLMLRSNAEMVERDRSHPSVIVWDIANESAWGANFDRIHTYTRTEDPTRPTLFSGAPGQFPTEIISWHYPGPGGPDRAMQEKQPVTFDEYTHLNCYNAEEVSLDPGLRDYYGLALERMWTRMQAADNCLGGTIWCWADDVFDIPGVGPQGYGEWGPIDGWQRVKPEWWHVRKVYSPTVIRIDRLEPTTGPVRIPIENRFNFTDLSEIRCVWDVGGEHGVLSPSVPPRTSGVLEIPAEASAGDVVELAFVSADGRAIDEYAIPVGGAPAASHPGGGPAPALEERPDSYAVSGDDYMATIDRATGSVAVQAGRECVVRAGPCVVAAATGTAQDAFADSLSLPARVVSAVRDDDAVHVTVERDQGAGTVRYHLSFFSDGTIETAYHLSYSGEEREVREIGLEWQMDPAFLTLSWDRDAQWNVYPVDHTGRLRGRAEAFHVPPGIRPQHWSEDPDPRGCNDFRSTKYNIHHAAISCGDRCVGVLPGGRQHVRATVRDGYVALRVNDFANGGGEGFLRSHYAAEARVIRRGEEITGVCRLQIVRDE